MTPEAIISGLSLIITITLLITQSKGKQDIAETKRLLAEWKTDAYEHRNSDREELRAWINGSFMRAAEVKIELSGLRRDIESNTRRLDTLESRNRRIDKHES